MELTDLRHFVNVARMQSFSRGALLSHVTTPAVSKAIRKIESELGVTLFERTTRRVALTPAGRAYLSRAERALAEVDAGAREATGRDDAVDGEMRIGAMEVVSIEALPVAIARILRQHPRLTVRTFELPPERIQDALVEGRIDLGLTIGGTAREGIESDEIGRSEGVLVCGRTHPLFRRGRVKARDVLEHRMIVPQFLGLENAPPIDQFPDKAWPRRTGLTVELLQMGVRLAIEGAGLGYFPRVSVRHDLDAGRLKSLSGLPRRDPFVVSAMTRTGAPRRPAVRVVIDALREQLRRPAPPRKR